MYAEIEIRVPRAITECGDTFTLALSCYRKGMSPRNDPLVFIQSNSIYTPSGSLGPASFPEIEMTVRSSGLSGDVPQKS